MTHPVKWRETCDSFGLPYTQFQPLEILGYPHAGNDVFHMQGLWHGKETRAYVKVARTYPEGIRNEVRLLKQLRNPLVPEILDWGDGVTPFVVTGELPGQRLSVLLGENRQRDAWRYLEDYGRMLSTIHNWRPEAGAVPDRRFLHSPSEDTLEKLGLGQMRDFFREPPQAGPTVFCHGDFHYANVLWTDRRITGILDFELSGYGDREFDIAWAMCLRPGQKFLQTAQEQEIFLQGFDPAPDLYAVHYHMAQIYVYFLTFSGEDRAYSDYVRQWLRRVPF